MEYKNSNFNIYGKQIEKFKTILIRIVFTCNVTERDFILSELLLAVLTYSNNNYHTNRELNMALQDLYDLYISCNSTRRGNKIVSTIECNMIDPKYTSKKVLKDSLKMLKDTVFNPYIVDNHFDTNAFNIIKGQFKAFIDSLSDNPQQLVNDKACSVYKDFDIGVSYTNAKQYLDEIDEYKLYDFYKEFLNNREIGIYICGNYNEDIINYLSKFPLKSKEIKYQDNKIINKVYEPTYLYKDYNQAKIALLLNFNDVTDFEKRYVSTIMNSILGGIQDSLLMESVREEHSLVYYIDSMMYKYDQAIIVYSGCDSHNTDLILKKVDECIDILRKGTFSDDKLKAAIIDVVNVLEDSERSPYLILDYMFSRNHINKDSLEDRMKKYKKVTREDVMALAKKLKKMNTVVLRDENERV